MCRYGIDYTVLDDALTWLDVKFVLDEGDEIVVHYFLPISIPVGSGSIYMPDGWL